MIKDVFDIKSPNFGKLISFGFVMRGDTYFYVTKILNGQFEMRVNISSGKQVKTELIDLSTGEPYALHLIAEASGAFVGAVRTEYERVLTEISEQCFEKDVFKSQYARRLIEYVREKYTDELQYLWKKFPSNAVWRRKDNDKWYGLLMAVSKRKLGLDSDEILDIVDLRVDSNILSQLIDGKRYFKGYHMNKKNWITICLDGSVSIDEICSRLDQSYILARKS